ncbi:MAG: hypothetical protein H0X62_10055 [Bacteroidetes bacterium]|nr:hypothetical protein [Bacteroidota bacterium]
MDEQEMLQEAIAEEEKEIEEFTGLAKVSKGKKSHPKQLANNIFHIVKVGRSVNVNAWKQICIGSDFDGMIRPINDVLTASHFNNLREILASNIKKYAGKAGVPVKAGDVSKIVNDIMLENALKFLKKNFI